MVTHCSNPDCGKPLHYLREGRIFLFEVAAPSVEGQPTEITRMEHFWLCGPCSQSMYVEKDGKRSVRVVPKTRARRPAPVMPEETPMAS